MAVPRVFCRLRLLVNKDFSVVSKHCMVRNSVFLNKNLQVHIVRQFRTHEGLSSVLDKNKQGADEPEVSSSSSSDDSDSDDDGKSFL
ncbi:hypothetical protein HHI36_004124 [Cryptolaemus montrouzieri]|uniref:Uncharacterized protein n=1 Tax=Cryptolaemus montrouzieri TaxID=559131 RepID=A0ABD2NQ97_9CUCU